MAEGSFEERWEVPERAYHFLNAAQLNVRGDSRLRCYYLSVDADEVDRAITILFKKRSQLPGLRVFP